MPEKQGKDKRKHPFIMVDTVMYDRGISIIGLKAFSVYVALLRYANNEGKSYPGISTIAKKLQVSENTVRKSIKILEQFQLITIDRHSDRAHAYEVEPIDLFLTLLPPSNEIGVSPSNQIGGPSNQIGGPSNQIPELDPITRSNNLDPNNEIQEVSFFTDTTRTIDDEKIKKENQVLAERLEEIRQALIAGYETMPVMQEEIDQIAYSARRLLAIQNATPEEIARRIAVYKEQYTIPFSAKVFVRNWDKLTPVNKAKQATEQALARYRKPANDSWLPQNTELQRNRDAVPYDKSATEQSLARYKRG